MEDYSTPPVIAKLGLSLSRPIPSRTADILSNVNAILALRFELADQTTTWLQLLYETRARMLWPKDKDKLTDLDREVRMRASTAVIKKDHEMLVALDLVCIERLKFELMMLETRTRE